MIRVDGLQMGYGGQLLFKDALFSLEPGERCGLVGRNGSGKSTLFRILTREETPDGGQVVVRKNYAIGMLNQHIRFEKTVLLEEAILGLREEERECVYKAETILLGLGFNEEDFTRLISDFSGGYQLRLHLAKLLLSEPDCLLLDEPTNYLDIVSIRWFTHFLSEWRGEFILISHDREFMDSVTTHTMGIHRQKIKKVKGSTLTFYENVFLEEEIYEKTRLNADKKRASAQNFVDRFGAKASKATQARSRQKMMARIPVLEKLKELQHLDFAFREAPFPGKKMVDCKELEFSYDDQELIRDFSLTIEKGERVGIIGKNGRGKSTLLRMLAKDLTPKGGELRHADKLAIGYFGQTHIDRLHPQHTVEEEIAAANFTLNRTQVMGICGLMMFSDDQAKKQISFLSGGERSRVLLGKLLAKPCQMLLLDEPTHHLDMESIEALIDALEDFEGAVVVVTHSELLLNRLMVNKLVVCRQSRQELFLGNYAEFLEKDGWHEVETPRIKKKSPLSAHPVPPISLDKSKVQKKRQKAIELKEMEISKLEQALLEAEKELVKAVHEKAASQIEERGVQIAQLQHEISRSYDELAHID